MCILPNIILPKPIQYVKAKIIFFCFPFVFKTFSFSLIFFSFPVFLLLVASFTTWAFPRRVPVSGVVQEHLVHAFERFGEIVLQGRERSANGWGAEAVRDETEVREAALDARLQDGAGPAVPDRCPVLRQQIRELFTKLPADGEGGREKTPSESWNPGILSHKPRGLGSVDSKADLGDSAVSFPRALPSPSS